MHGIAVLGPKWATCSDNIGHAIYFSLAPRLCILTLQDVLKKLANYQHSPQESEAILWGKLTWCPHCSADNTLGLLLLWAIEPLYHHHKFHASHTVHIILIMKPSQFIILTDTTSTQNKPSSFIVDSSCLSFFPSRLAFSSQRCTKLLRYWMPPSTFSSLHCIPSLSWQLMAAFKSSLSWDFSYKMNTHPLWDVSAETNEVGIHNCTSHTHQYSPVHFVSAVAGCMPPSISSRR